MILITVVVIDVMIKNCAYTRQNCASVNSWELLIALVENQSCFMPVSLQYTKIWPKVNTQYKLYYYKASVAFFTVDKTYCRSNFVLILLTMPSV